jgi:hypothetical protein
MAKFPTKYSALRLANLGFDNPTMLVAPMGLLGKLTISQQGFEQLVPLDSAQR